MNTGTALTHQRSSLTQKPQETSSRVTEVQDKKDSLKAITSVFSNESPVLDDCGKQQDDLNENAQNSRNEQTKLFKNLAQAALLADRIQKRKTQESITDLPLEVNRKSKKFAPEGFLEVTENILLRNVSLENEEDSKVC